MQSLDEMIDEQLSGTSERSESENSIKNEGMFSAKSKYHCNICPATFDEIRHVKCHWHDVHNKKHPSQCKICDIPFQTREEAHKHKRENHDFLCPICGKGFSNTNRLDNHVRGAHNTSIKYRCEICGVKKKRKELLINHMKEHESSLTGPLVFRCSICNKAFLKESELHEHENIHNNPIHCEFCNVLFPRKTALQRHKRDAHPVEHENLKRKAANEKSKQRSSKRRRR